MGQIEKYQKGDDKQAVEYYQKAIGYLEPEKAAIIDRPA